jgi:hypothetical protein
VSSIIEISQLAITFCFTAFFQCDWSAAQEDSSVVVVASLDADVRGAMEQAIPSAYNRKSLVV